jgi:SAM-dependent methyltransferase
VQGLPETYKSQLSEFLSRNPFPDPLTLGFFYREKMRAIYRVAPDIEAKEILDVGGGRSGLVSLLYPNARVTTLDADPSFANDPYNKKMGVRFVCGDATRLPFDDASFDAVTMFDLLEHIPEDKKAACEALRVLRPGGYLLATTPNENWRFPYYRFMKPFCPGEDEMFAAWGHVRRGYSLEQLNRLIGFPCSGTASFISPMTVLAHDVSFSRLPSLVRKGLTMALSPFTWSAYALQGAEGKGTETAYAWRKPLAR